MTRPTPISGDDLAAVTEILAGLGRPPPTSVTRMAGYDATVWRVRDGNETVAVRLLPSGRSPERELNSLRRAAVLGRVVPRVIADGRWNEHAVIVMSWCDGRPIGELLVAYDNGRPVATADDEVDRLARMFGAEQARLHEHDIAHLDFQPFNVLTDGDAITGIVDWNNCRPADLRLDLAHTQVVLDLAPALLPGLDVTPIVDGWQLGYRSRRPWPQPRELAPFLGEAATEQAANWEARAARGEISIEVAAAGRAIADTYAEAGVSSSDG